MNYLSALAIVLGIVSGVISLYEFLKKGSWRPGVAYSIAAAILLVAAVIVASLPAPSGTGIQASGVSPVQGSPTSPSGTGNTPITTQEAIPTPTPTPQAPTPTPTPLPKPGTVLYQANWSSGMNGWFNGSSQWNTVNGMLVSNSKLYYPDIPDAAATAPYKLDTTPDYAVEAQMQFVSCAYDHDCGFGVFLRWSGQGGYVGGMDAMNYGKGYAGIADIHTDHAYVCPTCGYSPIKYTDYTPGTDWHTYRVEVKGNDLKLFIDGALVIEVTDNTYLSGGQVGVESYNVQINVRSFKVIAL